MDNLCGLDETLNEDQEKGIVSIEEAKKEEKSISFLGCRWNVSQIKAPDEHDFEAGK